MPSYDITFCNTTVCPMRKSCHRAQHIPNDRTITQMDFYQPERDCTMYWPDELMKEEAK